MEDVEICPLWWKIFHFKKNFKKNFYSQRQKFFHFWWKNFHFGEFFFRHLDLLVSQIASQMADVDICPLWWKIFHFKKFPGKKFLFQNHMNWNIPQRWKFFHFQWKNFHFGEILFSGPGPQRLPLLSPNMQSGKFSTFVENFPLSKSCKKKFFCRIARIGTFCRGRKFFTFGGKFSILVKFYFRLLDLRV